MRVKIGEVKLKMEDGRCQMGGESRINLPSAIRHLSSIISLPSAIRYLLSVLLCTIVFNKSSQSQIENIPVDNQVYEFLDRMAIKGILPLYSNVMIPISRQEVAELLMKVDARKDQLNGSEQEFLAKFKQEFAHEIDPEHERTAVLFRDGFNADMFSDKEKYLYTYSDSTASLYMEFLGTLEYRRITGDSYGSTHASFEQHGGRIRGTIKNHLGYFLQGTDGTLFGDKTFALSDTRLRGSENLNNFGRQFFDFTEGYLRTDLPWFNVEFGREFTLMGTGYSDRLLLSNNAPAFDFIKLDAHYKSVKYVFLHGSLVDDSTAFPGLLVQEPAGSHKYLSMHRLQLSFGEQMNIGVSEMTIYQRFSPEFAYLNPIIFYKSVEHSLRDRDNSFLNFDIEYFPLQNYKLYGTWLIDDIDFSKIGTGWWGNEFGWQGGIYVTELGGIGNLDGTIEYTRIEPFVYSNRVSGNDYTHDNIGLGHHLNPNSDEWFLQLSYRPSKMLRTWLSFTRERHGENIVDANGNLIENVGGDILQGHRDIDSDIAIFLDGNLIKKDVVQLRASFEPINNLFLQGTYELRRTNDVSYGTETIDHYAAVQLKVEY